MAEATRDIRAEVERARERLADDVQALAHQANVPARLREKMSTRRASARLRENPKLPAVAAAAVAAAVGGVTLIVVRRRRGGGEPPSSANGSHNVHAGEVLGVISRPAMVAAMQHRRAKKAGRSPGAKQFAAYTAVGTATTLATKWAHARIARSASPAD